MGFEKRNSVNNHHRPGRLSGLGLAAVLAAGAAGMAVAPATQARGEDDPNAAEQYVSDAAVTARVKSALIQTDGVSALDMSVETSEGVVQLSGFVDNEDQIELAEDVAEQQEGVREVKNDLRVEPAAE